MCVLPAPGGRELQPAAVVLEDVDLVAEDRGYGPGPSPVLFTLLDAMDGAAADADLLFVLTTNRADLLEPALAARPGRVDVALEIALPDADAGRRLFDVCSRSLPLVLDETEIDEIVERTAGVAASFVKELLRRAALEALGVGDGSLDAVTNAHVSRALDDLAGKWPVGHPCASGRSGRDRGPGRSGPERGGPAWRRLAAVRHCVRQCVRRCAERHSAGA